MPLPKTAAAKIIPLIESCVMPEMMWPLVQPPASRAPKMRSTPPRNASRYRRPVLVSPAWTISAAGAFVRPSFAARKPPISSPTTSIVSGVIRLPIFTR